MKRRLLALNLAILLLIPLLTPAAQAMSVSISAPSTIGATATKIFTSTDRNNELSVNVPVSGWYSLRIETTTSSGNLMLYDDSGSTFGFGQRGTLDYRVDAYLEAGSYTADHLPEYYSQNLKYTLTASRLAVAPLTLVAAREAGVDEIYRMGESK